MGRPEMQVKLADNGCLTIEKLVAFGGEFLGMILQEDVYYRHNNSDQEDFRLREESGMVSISFERRKLRHDSCKPDGYNVTSFERELKEGLLSSSDAKRIRKEHKHCTLIRVFKTRKTVRFHRAIIIFDQVEYLGDYIKIRAENRRDLDETLSLLDRLGFKIYEQKFLTDSYVKMMIDRQMPNWLKALQAFHRHIGELTFGIVSGILTTCGLMAGVFVGSSDKTMVMISIGVIACADSLSDSFSMFRSKLSERGVTVLEAFRFCVGTLIGKIVLPLTFLIALALIDSLVVGVLVNMTWGLFVLILLTIEQSLISEESIWKGVLQNGSLAIFLVGASSFIGYCIETSMVG